MSRTENCTQCNKPANQHPVAIVMNMRDVLKLEHDEDKKVSVIEMRDNGEWAVLPVCTACHNAPRLKGHYFYRLDAARGLARAGDSNLG